MTNIQTLMQEFTAAEAALEAVRARLIAALQGIPADPVVWSGSYPSRSDASVLYEVTRYASGKRTCTCPGFRFRASCRHTNW